MKTEVEKKIMKNLAILAEDHGQQRSIEEMLPIGPSGEPLPWYTYPALENLLQFDFSNCSVFEYGCGHSSLWWADRAAWVHSVDHDGHWARRIESRAPANLTIMHESQKDAYVRSIERPGIRFDVVVIDGRWRLACSSLAHRFLRAGGLIVFDNSDWYTEAPAVLHAEGFLQIDFSGFGPINNYCWTTSLFFKALLGIARKASFVRPVGGLVNSADYSDD